MKNSIRKFGLSSIVPAMTLAALFTACGDDSKNGVDGAPGEQGAAGESGKSCSAKPLADGSGYTLTCGDKDVGVIRNGVNGVKGKDGVGCKAEPMANGDYEISCGGTVVGILFNGNGSSDGQGETGGTSCSAKALEDGSGYTLTCDGVDVGTISNGRDGYSCQTGQNEDKTVTTITCETANGEVSYEVANGKDGEGCEISKNGYELTITCANSKEVVDLRDFIVASSSSETNSSSSEEGISSSSVTPETDPDVTPDTESSDSSESDESSSPSVTPDPVPGANSSSSEEVPAEVKPNGYYSNSENCPAGLTCKYATTTDYLNSTKNYGEILDTRDGQVYKAIEICDNDNNNCQTWMAQNLNYRYVGVKFREGTEYESDSTSWCYEDKVSNCDMYGRLYTWAAAVDSVSIRKNFGEECGYDKSCARFSASELVAAPVRGACPLGWHLPSDEEWSTLFMIDGLAGRALKAKTGLWPGDTGNDDYGFSIFPAGVRGYYGDFSDKGRMTTFWSSTEYKSSDSYGYGKYALLQGFINNDYLVRRDKDLKVSGYSVRCLKD